MSGSYITADGIKSLLKNGSQVSVFECLESTNLTAKVDATKGAKEGDVIVALSQTGGRGRFGRSFYSPDSSGVYFSIILRPKIMAEEISFITPVAAVAVSQAIEEITKKSPKIKWVNDIFIKDKKVCGILSEAAFNSDGSAEYVILGIGINLFSPKGGFPNDIKNIAGSLMEDGEKLNPNELIAAVVNTFFELYKDLKAEKTVKEYQKRMLLEGARVDYIQNGEQKSGVVEGIDDSFQLIIKNENGDLTHLQSGEVTIGSNILKCVAFHPRSGTVYSE